MTRGMTHQPPRTTLMPFSVGGVVAALCLAVGLSVVLARPAAAAVAFVDRLGCGSTDVERTPVFEFVGSGNAVAGAAYATTTNGSGYPAARATFTAAAGGAPTGTITPDAYGPVFGGVGALLLTGVQPGRSMTMRVALPRAQRVQLTVGGIDRPARVTVSGTSSDGSTVPAEFAERGTAPGRATATSLGGAVRIAGGSVGGVDERPDKAVDVWFSSPVASVTFQSDVGGGGLEGGYLVTPPLGCQEGELTAAGSDPVLVSTDPGSGDLTYDATFSVDATNAAGATDMDLGTTIATDLRTALDGIPGASVVSVDTALSGPGAASCADAGDGALTPTGLLTPGETCTATITARVVVPQSQAPVSAAPTWTWRSSGGSASRLKATASATVTFPAVRSGVEIATSGPVEALPDHTVSGTLTVTNSGPGTLLGPTLVATVPAGLSATTGAPGCAVAGSALSCDLQALPPDDSVDIPLDLTVAPDVEPGTNLTLAATLDATSEPAAVGGDLVVTVVGLDPPVLTGPSSPTTGRRPAISGTGRPGARVTVTRGSTELCTATVAASGRFSCTPSTDLPYGASSLTATQRDGSVSSGVSSPWSVTVVRPQEPPPPPRPTPTPPPPPPVTTPDPVRPQPPGPVRPPPPFVPPAEDIRPTATPDPSPAGPTPAPTASPESASPGSPIGMSFAMAGGSVTLGTAGRLQGVLGPNTTSEPLTLVLSGRAAQGLIYRGVDVDVEASCEVTTSTFRCTIVLPPGQSATVTVRMLADAGMGAGTFRQRVIVTPADASDPALAELANTSTISTQVTAVGGGEGTATEQLAASISGFPGPFLLIFVLLLMAVAATVAERDE